MDKVFIKRTLNLARKGLGWTNPNPLVGAVLIKDQKIIAEGFHHKFGNPHAEVEAINNLRENPKDTTMYVNLEPCSYSGKTPPCTDLIIKSGIRKVVCATLDPNPKVWGKGIKKLKAAGIKVITGVLEKEAMQLNEAFFTFHQKKRPFVVVKFAASLDGKIATYSKNSKWITGEKSRQFTHKLRGQYQAVLVGINTVVLDNPHLGTRIEGLKNPLRIILDPRLRIPLDSQVLRDNNVLIASTSQAPPEKLTLLRKKGINILIFKNHKIQISRLLNKLTKMDIISILVEGGGTTLGNFVDEKLVDKVYAFFGPLIIGGNKAIPAIGGIGAETVSEALYLTNSQIEQFDRDFLIWGYTK